MLFFRFGTFHIKGSYSGIPGVFFLSLLKKDHKYTARFPSDLANYSGLARQDRIYVRINVRLFFLSSSACSRKTVRYP